MFKGVQVSCPKSFYNIMHSNIGIGSELLQGNKTLHIQRYLFEALETRAGVDVVVLDQGLGALEIQLFSFTV